MKQLESLLANNILLYIDLNALTSPLQVRKAGLPHQPQGRDAAGDADLAFCRFEFQAGSLTVLINQRRGSVPSSGIPVDKDRVQAPGSVRVSFWRCSNWSRGSNCKGKSFQGAMAFEYNGAPHASARNTPGLPSRRKKPVTHGSQGDRPLSIFGLLKRSCRVTVPREESRG